MNNNTSRKRNISSVERTYPKKTSNKKKNIKKKIKESSIVYFVVLCHGAVNFTKNANDDEYKPINIKIPEEISFFNKITFAPLGIYNMMHDEDNEIIIEKLKTEIPKLYSKQEGYGEILADKLKNENLLDDPEEELKTETNPRSRGYFHILNNNKDQFYQSVIYDKNNKSKNIPIIQKQFSLDHKVDNNEFDDIFVVFQREGSLKKGEKILNNNKIFKDYMVKLWEKNITKNIDNDGNYIYIPKITTDELLEIAVEYGYAKVVIIDYSCDYCRNVVDPHTKIPRDKIIKWRKDVKKGEFSRGGIHKTIFKKKGKTKKLKY